MIKKIEIIKSQTIPAELESNLELLLSSLNKFRKFYSLPMIVTSGYRSPAHNAQIGGAANSAHCTCQACDFDDRAHQIRDFILSDPSILIDCNLYCEDFDSTPTWVHLQTRPTASGSRIFKP